MVTPGLYYGLQRTYKTSATFPNKAHRNDIPFLIDLGLQGHQTWMTGSLDLSPKKSKNIHKFQIILKFVLINMKLEKIIHYKHTELFFFAN